jgi:RHS repeat-associated protein
MLVPGQDAFRAGDCPLPDLASGFTEPVRENANPSYYRARYYDPSTGRFISEDRARFGGGFDFYAYVKNDPVDFIDPTGLKCWQSSPWIQIPDMSGSKGPSPYLTIEDGLFWVPVGWNYVNPGKVSCICHWIATHTLVRKFYRATFKEEAQFTCDCPVTTYYATRERTHEWEVDSPGQEFWPPKKRTTTAPHFTGVATQALTPCSKARSFAPACSRRPSLDGELDNEPR